MTPASPICTSAVFVLSYLSPPPNVPHPLLPTNTYLDPTPASMHAHADSNRLHLHPKLLSEQELTLLTTKAHLVIRMIQLKIGQDLLLQVYNSP